MQKTGQIERTVDREFAEEEGRYRTWVLVPVDPFQSVAKYHDDIACWFEQYGAGNDGAAERGKGLP